MARRHSWRNASPTTRNSMLTKTRRVGPHSSKSFSEWNTRKSCCLQYSNWKLYIPLQRYFDKFAPLLTFGIVLAIIFALFLLIGELPLNRKEILHSLRPRKIITLLLWSFSLKWALGRRLRITWVILAERIASVQIYWGPTFVYKEIYPLSSSFLNLSRGNS